MVKISPIFRKMIPFFSIALVMIWLSNLASTDAYFSVYALLAFFSFFLQIRNYELVSDFSMPASGLSLFLSVFFSLLVLLGNYPIFTTIGDPALIGRSTSIVVNLINAIMSFVGGICVSYPILNFVFYFVPLTNSNLSIVRKWTPWCLFGSIFFIHLLHLLLVEFPGNLTEDSFTQISEMLSGSYSNFNTFWHTILFQGVLKAGYCFFSEVNAAVCFAVILQMTLLVAAFTHSLMTMLLYGVPKWVVSVAYLLFAIVPYNMALTITIWKDVLFAGGCLLMLSTWVRIRFQLGKYRGWNYVVFVLGSLVFILARTNGWFIYLLSSLVFLLFFNKNRSLLVLMGIISVIGWFLLNPALVVLNVESGDLAESLSIPIQQVSRVIVDGGDLTQEEEALLDKVVDLKEVPDLYVNWLSDPMKVEVRSKDYAYFQENFDEYVSLWFQLGLRYPSQYVKAWVDQTKGYWNAGYDYAMYSETVTDNPYGVEKRGGGNPIATLFRLYFGLSRHVIIFEPLHSIGLHVWIFLLCLILNIWNKRDVWVFSVPLLILLVGLWFGTPVYCCFRYVYPLFVCFPLIVSTTVWNHSRIIKAAE